MLAEDEESITYGHHDIQDHAIVQFPPPLPGLFEPSKSTGTWVSSAGTGFAIVNGENESITEGG